LVVSKIAINKEAKKFKKNILRENKEVTYLIAKLHITADKMEIFDFPKFAYRRTSFIRKPLCAIGCHYLCVGTK